MTECDVIVTRSGAVLALDIGGSKTAAALVDAAGRVSSARVVPTSATAGPRKVLDDAAHLAVSVAAGERVRISAIGVGTAGVVDVTRGTIVATTATFTDWAGTDVAAGLRSTLPSSLASVPIHVENDVDAHAAGESWTGAARGYPSVLYLAVGTGVGASIVIDDRTHRGSRHAAGEIGHTPVAGAGHLLCPCGRRGHLEAIGSGPGLLRHYLSLGGATTARTPGVLQRAGGGDETATRAVSDSASSVGRALAGAIALLDPAVVVVGGGMAQAGAMWWDAMERAARDELMDHLADIGILRTGLDGNAALVGAARGAWALATGRGEAP